jgi:hypothetical protein
VITNVSEIPAVSVACSKVGVLVANCLTTQYFNAEDHIHYREKSRKLVFLNKVSPKTKTNAGQLKMLDCVRQWFQSISGIIWAQYELVNVYVTMYTPTWVSELLRNYEYILNVKTTRRPAFVDTYFDRTIIKYYAMKSEIIYLSICLSVALQPLWTLTVFQFLNLYTVGRTPCTGEQPVARSLPTHRKTETENKCTQPFMPRVEFETTIPVFERAKTVHDLVGEATVRFSRKWMFRLCYLCYATV